MDCMFASCGLRPINVTKPYRPETSILIPPHLYRCLCSSHALLSDVILQPTPFGTRQPTLPVARTITLARIATTEGVDKRYERSWLRGMKAHFAGSDDAKHTADIDMQRLVRRGDVIAVPVWLDKAVTEGEPSSGSEESEGEDLIWRTWPKKRPATEVAYFSVSALSYEPLVPIDEDFRSSISSKARAGELGCWIDIGVKGCTRMVIAGVEKTRVRQRDGDRHWCRLGKPLRVIKFTDLAAVIPPPSNPVVEKKFRQFFTACFAHTTSSYNMQLSILLKGAGGAGKTTIIKYLANEIGLNVVVIECYDIIGDTASITEGTIRAQLDKAMSCAPSILLLKHLEALARKTESSSLGRPPAIVKVLEDSLSFLRQASMETQWPCIMIGTTAEEDGLPPEVLNCFKQDIVMSVSHYESEEI